MTVQLFERDDETSTITIADRRFPAVILICPPTGDDDEDDDLERSLGATPDAPGDKSVFVPAENGILFQMEPVDPDRPERGLILSISARTCYPSPDTDGRFYYLPHPVSIKDGKVAPGRGGVSIWKNAEPDWVVETIDRLSQAPYVEPEGPLVEMVRLDHFSHAAEAETA